VKTARAGGAASVGAGNRGAKRKVKEPPLLAGVAPKVAKGPAQGRQGRRGRDDRR